MPPNVVKMYISASDITPQILYYNTIDIITEISLPRTHYVGSDRNGFETNMAGKRQLTRKSSCRRTVQQEYFLVVSNCLEITGTGDR